MQIDLVSNVFNDTSLLKTGLIKQLLLQSLTCFASDSSDVDWRRIVVKENLGKKKYWYIHVIKEHATTR